MEDFGLLLFLVFSSNCHVGVDVLENPAPASVYLEKDRLVFLSVFSQPIFKPIPTSQDAIDGRWATLQCGIGGSNEQNYVISWLNGGKPVVDDNRRYQEGNNLYFRPIDKDLDRNKFQCQATEISTRRSYVTDPVEFKIKWFHVGDVELKKPSSPALILPDVGGGVVLECNIAGYPKPNNISWFTNGRYIRRGGPHVRMKDGRLMINPVKMKIDDGAYTCCASHLLAARPNRYECTPSGGEFNLKVLDRSIPRLVKAPQDKVVVRGGSVTLDCAYEAVPSPDIVWRKNGSSREITSKPRRGRCARRCVHVNGSLELVDMKESMEGEYVCLARQGTYEAQPVSAAVQLAYIKEFATKSTEKYALLGDKFEFNCTTPLSLPSAEVTWSRNRKIIGDSDSHISTIRMSTLVIDSLGRGDVGMYTCSASNVAGSVSTDVAIKLGVPPTLGRLGDKHTEEGSNVSWSCPASGIPFPSVTWYKNNVEIDGSSGNRIFNAANLTLVNVTMKDQGIYKCTATNQVFRSGVVSSNPAQLIITERLKFWPVLEDMCIAAGEDQQVLCSVNGSDNPSIRWIQLLDGTEGTAVSQSSSGSLVLANPGRSDSGSYRCIATTPSTTISATIRIDVVARPKILIPPHDVAVFEGKRAMFDCATSPKKKSKVTWEFRGKSYSPSQGRSFESDMVIFSNGSLLIPQTKAKDSGFYTCSYDNCGVLATAIAELIVAEDVPGDPGLNNPPTPAGGPTSGMIQTIALAVSGGVAYLLITVALIIYFRRKRRRKRKSRTGRDEEEKMLKGAAGNGRSHGNHDDEIVKLKNGILMEDLCELDPRITKLNYPSSNIHPTTVLGKGEFGDVFLSKAPGLVPSSEVDHFFMVKTYHPQERSKESRSVKSSRSEFNREVNLLFKSTHDHVTKLLAIGSKYSKLKPDFFVLEYLDWGILKLYLKASKEGKIPNISKSSKMNLCCQLAGGLEHLNNLGFIHKDVAARNCVVSSRLVVKVSLIGLSKQGFEGEYHEHDGALVPVRWMAPETLLEGRYSFQSDVWSFAVTCWEIFSLGETPYEELTDDEYIAALRTDDVPHLQPLEGVKRMSALIKKCCRAPPSERPEIKQITRKLQSIVRSDDGSLNGQLKAKALVATATDDSATDER